jgi:hypothetical protein
MSTQSVPFFISPPFLGLFLPRPQYVSRKTLAIKRGDSEILTRNDVQYTFLYHVFSDKTLAFTDETPGKPPIKVNFCDLYVHALYNSTKCSKVMRDKMLETPAFAIEFAKISLLTNVGRINTTMACMCYCSSHLSFLSTPMHSFSLPRDENRLAKLPPGPITPEDGWECTGCSQDKELSQGGFLARRAKVSPPVYSC